MSQAQSAAGFEGKTITRIDFVPPIQPFTAQELQSRVLLHPGQPLRIEDVRDTMQNLYSTGRYSDLSVDVEPDRGGAALRIQTEFNYFVSGVNISGESDPPNTGQIAAAAKLELGAPFADDQLAQAQQNVEELLRANGFYSASVETHVDRTPATQEANIYFFIHTGDRAHFDGVRFLGQFNVSRESLIHATNWRRKFLFITFPGWREMTKSRLQTGIGEVQETLQKSDRPLARATLEELQFHPATNRVTPVLRLDMGPVIQVRVMGAKVSPHQLRELIPIYQERAIDRGLLLEGRQNLLNYFQSRGYFDASVDFVQSEPQPGHSLIDYSVSLGARHKLVRLDIRGNRYFDYETLRERLSTTPASFPRYPWGRFSQRMIERDRASIEDLYRANGFRDVKVETPPPIDSYKGVPGHLAVAFDIHEGSQWLVSQLDLEGVSQSEAARLRPLLQSLPGQPFSEAAVTADRDAILTYYFNQGYPDARFDWTQTPGPAPTSVALKYTVEPGQPLFVRNVLVRGLEATRPFVVADQISLNPGDPMSQLKMVGSQQRLYELSIFSRVQTALQNPDGEEDRKNVLFHLDEASKWSLNGGIGAQLGRIGGGTTTFDSPAGATTFTPRLSFGLTRLNVFGLAHTVGVQTLFSTIEQRVVTTYAIPQFMENDKLSLSVSGLFDNSNDIRTFTSRRLEGSVQLAQRLSRANTLQYRYSYRRVTIPADTLKIEPELIPLFSQPDRAGIVSFSFINDQRDNPIDSTRGFLNTVDWGWAGRQLGSATTFSRLQFSNSTYHRIRRNLVFARVFRFGYLQRYAGGVAVPPGTPSWEEVPLAERFFSGGASTDRAFPENQAGPRDLVTGFPLGGNAYLFHSEELRFPLYGDNLGGVFFHDMGNVYSSITAINLRFWQLNRQDFDYAVHAFGFGVRYRTPIGPIRVDLSLSPDSPRFVGFSGTREQLLSGAGTPNVPQRINIFQFHFSLGQTF
ncbi:MAG TPA: POTRA domain-containing protein [Bryobacteraceae bacterium]|nr:POTRA domain-containing protein [Bryobacteraceae bacterium]